MRTDDSVTLVLRKAGRLRNKSSRYDCGAMSKQTARRPPTARTITRILGIDIEVHTSWLISLLVLSYYAYDQIAPDVVRRGTKPQLLVAIGFGMAIAVC